MWRLMGCETVWTAIWRGLVRVDLWRKVDFLHNSQIGSLDLMRK
jgi:hypothetical protein